MSQFILIVVFIIMLIISLSNNKRPTPTLTLLLGLILIIVIVFRDSQMADYREYVRIFEYYPETVEIFHKTLIYNLRSLGFGYIAYFFIIAILTVSIELYSIEKMTDRLWAISILVWLGSSFILNDMVTIRAGLAGALMLMMIKAKADHHIKASLLFYILAILCHMSSAILIFIFFLSTNHSYRVFYLLCLTGGFACPLIGFSLTDFLGVVGIDLLDAKLEIYLQGDTEANIFSLFQLLRYAIAFCLWINYNKLSSHNKYFPIALKTYTIGCIWYFLNYKIMAIGWRISCLLWTTDVIVYPLLVYLFSNKLKNYWKFVPASIAAILFIANVTMNQYWSPK